MLLPNSTGKKPEIIQPGDLRIAGSPGSSAVPAEVPGIRNMLFFVCLTVYCAVSAASLLIGDCRAADDFIQQLSSFDFGG